MAEISGVVRLQSGKARLYAEGQSVVLVPYPADAPIDPQQKEVQGSVLFAYLRNQKATLIGDLHQGKLFNARVRAGAGAGSDIPISPEEHNEITDKIEKILQKDSRAVAR